MTIDPADVDPVKIRYLERLYDHAQTRPGEVMESGPFLMQESGLTLAAALDLTRALDGLGLVRHGNAMGNPAAILLDAGREFVGRLRARRDDPVVRAEAARRSLLACVYDSKLKGREAPDPAATARCPHGEFLGGRFNQAELLRAVDYLEGKELLAAHNRNASGKPGYVQLTPNGEECMEETGGDVAEYLRRQRVGQTVYETHISGGQGFAIGSSNFTQHNHAGVDPAALRELVSHVLPELGRFGASEPQARVALEEIAEEADDAQPNPGRIRQALGRVLGFAKEAGLPLVVAYLTYKAQELGMLPAPQAPPVP